MAEQKNTKSKPKFNPVQADKSGVKAARMIWSSSVLEAALQGLEQGRKLIYNPFYEGNVKLMKGDLTFEHTPEEVEEWKKCKNDILYFAEKYCKLMTPKGVKNITLRDYQKEYLRHLEKNRLSIMVSCRQAGKCNSLISNTLCRFDKALLEGNCIKKFDKKKLEKLKKEWETLYYIKEQDCYNIPLFELYNLYDDSFLWKIKYKLYKFIYKLHGNSKETKQI